MMLIFINNNIDMLFLDTNCITTISRSPNLISNLWKPYHFYNLLSDVEFAFANSKTAWLIEPGLFYRCNTVIRDSVYKYNYFTYCILLNVLLQM